MNRRTAYTESQMITRVHSMYNAMIIEDHQVQGDKDVKTWK